MQIRVKIDAERVSAEFKQASRDIRQRTKAGLLEGAKRAALPRVRAGAPSIVDPVLTARATTKSAYITTQGRKVQDRITGLLNFGGTVTTKIAPKKKQALALRGLGVVVAAVDTPRRYRGSHFIEKGVDAARPEIERTTLVEVMKAFDGLQHSP